MNTLIDKVIDLLTRILIAQGSLQRRLDALEAKTVPEPSQLQISRLDSLLKTWEAKPAIEALPAIEDPVFPKVETL